MRKIAEELAKECVPIDENLTKLTEFMDSEYFMTLSAPSQKLLVAQSTAMATYINILVARIALFNAEHTEDTVGEMK